MNTVWIIGGGLFLFALYMFDVDKRWLAAFTVAWIGWTFNSIVSARNQAQNAFSSIDVMLKKRFDLIPGLVDTVARYIEHESDVLEQVTQLRAEAMAGKVGPDEAAMADQQMERALAQLFATAEAYPELKANDSFQQLQRGMNEVEEQISAARRSYNASVKAYNDAVSMFPTNLFARVLGFKERSFFELPQGQTEAPDVMARFRSHENG